MHDFCARVCVFSRYRVCIKYFETGNHCRFNMTEKRRQYINMKQMDDMDNNIWWIRKQDSSYWEQHSTVQCRQRKEVHSSCISTQMVWKGRVRGALLYSDSLSKWDQTLKYSLVEMLNWLKYSLTGDAELKYRLLNWRCQKLKYFVTRDTGNWSIP